MFYFIPYIHIATRNMNNYITLAHLPQLRTAGKNELLHLVVIEDYPQQFWREHARYPFNPHSFISIVYYQTSPARQKRRASFY